MPGEKQMVPGFNHNVKHKGTPYHVQTEDSGIDNPRIITHLFVGGNVIASKKTSYADIVGAENLAQVVRELMEEQHKEMLRNLISGVYDDTEEEVAAKARAYQPGQIAAQSAESSEPHRAATEDGPAKPLASAKASGAPGLGEAAKPGAAPRPPPIPRPPSQALQRAAAAPGPTAERPLARPAAVAAAPAGSSPQAVRAGAAHPPGSAPAAQTRASPGGRRNDDADAGFGEDLISEKSLDEVILSYLAEDQAGKA